MRITIVGAGAMGSLMAANLTRVTSARAASTDSILLYSRPSRHIDAIRDDGLRVKELDGTESTVPVAVSSNPADVEGSDLVIMLVRSWSTTEVAVPLRRYLSRQSIVLTLQNGLGNASQLRTALLNDGVRPHVWLGVTAHEAVRLEPGQIVHTSDGLTAIGRRSAELNPTLREVASTLTGTGWETVAVQDIHRWIWRKLAVNAVINPLTALANAPTGELVRNAELRHAAEQISAEVVAVARARNLGIDLPEIAAAIEQVAHANPDGISSMLYDIRAGERTEIDAINGAITKAAQNVGVATPVNAFVTSLLRARERHPAEDAGAPHERRG